MFQGYTDEHYGANDLGGPELNRAVPDLLYDFYTNWYPGADDSIDLVPDSPQYIVPCDQ
jgi:hypothetical protein